MFETHLKEKIILENWRFKGENHKSIMDGILLIKVMSGGISEGNKIWKSSCNDLFSQRKS